MTAVVAVCENGGIGREGALLFHIREDLRRFPAADPGENRGHGPPDVGESPRGPGPAGPAEPGADPGYGFHRPGGGGDP